MMNAVSFILAERHCTKDSEQPRLVSDMETVVQEVAVAVNSIILEVIPGISPTTTTATTLSTRQNDASNSQGCKKRIAELTG